MSVQVLGSISFSGCPLDGLVFGFREPSRDWKSRRPLIILYIIMALVGGGGAVVLRVAPGSSPPGLPETLGQSLLIVIPNCGCILLDGFDEALVTIWRKL